MATIHPQVSWAQRKDCVLLTVDIVDSKDVKIKVTDSISFSATADGKNYAFDIPLFAEVIAEESSNNVRPRAVEIKLIKKDQDAEFWGRLTSTKGKNPKITIDWNRWKDEDELDGKDDTGDFGQGGMPGMGGMGGMGGMEGMMGGMGGMGGAGGAGGMDMAALQQMMAGMGGGGAGGMPGMGGMPPMGEDKDSDDEEMPPLEE